MDSLFDISGKVAFITGGHSWLGFDMASILAQYGANIIIASRNEEKLKNACEKIKEKYKVECTYFILDQTSPDSCAKVAENAYNWKQRIDILINNSGGGSGNSEGDFLKRSTADISSLISINLTGCLYLVQAIGKYMINQKSGKIINIGSIAGIVGRDRSMYRRNNKMEQPIDYAASKAGIIGATRDLAAYFAPYNIQVNSISPGGFDKGDLPEGFVNDYSKGTMCGHMGIIGKDIKGPTLFLASAASDYVTGHNLVVDGGFTIYK